MLGRVFKTDHIRGGVLEILVGDQCAIGLRIVGAKQQILADQDTGRMAGGNTVFINDSIRGDGDGLVEKGNREPGLRLRDPQCLAPPGVLAKVFYLLSIIR